MEEWGEYLSRRSSFGAESTIKDTMRRRLSNLVERGLVERKGHLYSTTPNGLVYLQKTRDEDSVGAGDHNQVRALVRQQENTVRESLRELLRDMDPFAFEHLIKRLLEELDYQNVEVTARSGDGGASTWWATLSWESRRSGRSCRSSDTAARYSVRTSTPFGVRCTASTPFAEPSLQALASPRAPRMRLRHRGCPHHSHRRR